MMGSNESSVAVSLRELMQLEHDRVVAEENAARTVEAREAQEAREATHARNAEGERARRLEHEREREAQAEAARRRSEHEAAMLRVRCEVEAQERAERERLALEHQRALRRLDLDVESRRLVRALVAILVTGTAGVAIAYGVVIEPALRAAVDRETTARRVADGHVAENAVLSRRLREAVAKPVPVVSARAETQGVSATTVASFATVPPQAHTKVRAPGKRPSTPIRRPAEEEDVLGDLDDESDDPIRGAIDSRRTQPARSR